MNTNLKAAPDGNGAPGVPPPQEIPSDQLQQSIQAGKLDPDQLLADVAAAEQAGLLDGQRPDPTPELTNTPPTTAEAAGNNPVPNALHTSSILAFIRFSVFAYPSDVRFISPIAKTLPSTIS